MQKGSTSQDAEPFFLLHGRAARRAVPADYQRICAFLPPVLTVAVLVLPW